MGMTLFTNNALSSISDPDFFNPGWDTTGLKRMEIFTYGSVGGGNMATGEAKSIPVGSPAMLTGTPWAEFTSYGTDVPHLRLGMADSSPMTWICLFDPANSTLQRLVMSSYGGTSGPNLAGTSIVVDATGKLGMYIGRMNKATGVYSTQWAALPQFVSGKPMLLAVTMEGRVSTIKDLTNGLISTVTLSEEYDRSFGSNIYVGKGPVSSWGDASGKNRIAAYAVFNRVLSDTEQTAHRTYLLKCIQAKFPAVTF